MSRSSHAAGQENNKKSNSTHKESRGCFHLIINLHLTWKDREEDFPLIILSRCKQMNKQINQVWLTDKA